MNTIKTNDVVVVEVVVEAVVVEEASEDFEFKEDQISFGKFCGGSPIKNGVPSQVWNSESQKVGNLDHACL
jgi:hypothetical protein